MENIVRDGNAPIENIPLQAADLRPPELQDIAAVLRNEMSNAFSQLEVNISACPCLNTEPYNLAGDGLCGNTSVISVGSLNKLFEHTPRPDNATWDIRETLSASCHNSFIIGAGYAAKPHMPCNGHLVMNAMYRSSEDITNASRIVFAKSNGQRIIEMLTRSDQMNCSFMGRFFVSEGRKGDVIRLQAKGRKCNVDIITLMQDALRRGFNADNQIVLGGVLKVTNGRVAQTVMPEQYPSQITNFDDLGRWFQCHDMDLESDLIAVGTISNSRVMDFWFRKLRHGYYLPMRDDHFHSFSNYGAGGQFVGDTTKDMTEYDVYLNVARKLHYAL